MGRTLRRFPESLNECKQMCLGFRTAETMCIMIIAHLVNSGYRMGNDAFSVI